MIRRPSLTLSVLIAAIGLSAAAWRVQAQAPSAIPLQSPPRIMPVPAHAPRSPVAWSSLNARQRRILAPVRNQWSQLQPARQHRLAANALRWARLPPRHQQQIRERLARWAAMTPDERRQLRENARVFHNLTSEERAKVSEAFRKFQSLPPPQQRALRERWRAMHPRQRLRWTSQQPKHPIPMHPPTQGGH